jgi:phosphoesterase RecJ-like protein
VLVALVDELGVPLDTSLATVLLAGIVRDSHGFSDLATSASTLRVAARLVDAGAPLAAVQRAILADLPYPTMALWGLMLGGIGERVGGRVVYAALTLEMLHRTGTQQHDADGLVEFMFTVKGADVVVLLRELEGGGTRVSLRTTDAVDATGIAARFGGGGHRQRAGCTLPSPLEDAVPLVLAACEAALTDD